jgi:hypothetical protein
MRTTQFSFNVGINSGYFHNNPTKPDIGIKIVNEIWQEEAVKVFDSTGIYVAALAHPVKTLYNEAWGCPKGGEDTVVLTGLLNPKFLSREDTFYNYSKDLVPTGDAIDKWQATVKIICEAVAKRLDQTTAYLSFSEIDFDYLELKVKNGQD